jgi:hypothetical protein
MHINKVMSSDITWLQVGKHEIQMTYPVTAGTYIQGQLTFNMHMPDEVL